MARLDPVDECVWPAARAWDHYLGPAVWSLAPVAGPGLAHERCRRHLLLEEGWRGCALVSVRATLARCLHLVDRTAASAARRR